MNSEPLTLENPAVQLRQSPRLRHAPRLDSFVEFPKSEIDQSIPARFEKQVEHYPDRIAVKTQGGALTYHELNRLANRVAHALLKRDPLGAAPVAFLLSHGV